jgi:hypothetical protein
MTFMITAIHAFNCYSIFSIQAVTFHIIPVANPDGYAYSQSKAHEARHWYKNRGGGSSSSSHSKHHAKAADIAHSWSSSSSSIPPENAAIEQFSRSLSSSASHKNGKGGLSAFVSVHCCGGQVVGPGKLKCGALGSDDKVHKASSKAKDAKLAQKSLGEKLARAMAQPAPGRTVHPYTFKLEHTKDVG